MAYRNRFQLIVLIITLFLLVACGGSSQGAVPDADEEDEGDVVEATDEADVEEPEEDEEEEVESEDPLAQPGESEIEVEDQSLTDGNIVVVSRVLAERAGWISVHLDLFTAPGAVIGHVEVPAGESLDVEIEIDAENLTPRLHVMLHVDRGVLGEFEYPGPDD